MRVSIELRGGGGRALLWALALAVLLAATAEPAASQPAAQAAASGGVKLRVATASQAKVIRSGRLPVRIRSASAARVRLGAKQGKLAGIVRRKVVRMPAGSRRLVRLRLTKRGRTRLRLCGARRVTLVGRVRTASGRGRARSSRRLRGNFRNCVLHVGAKNLARCDPIDAANCLAPFPNDYFTTADSSTPTGRRVNLKSASLPQNARGVSSFHPELNRNDGFSPNNVILSRVPGIETPAAFKANGLVPLMNIGAHDDPGQRVLLINAETGERHPIWAELDMIPGTPNPHAGGEVNGTANDRLLLIHPAVALDHGTRYIVALRSLTNASGAPLSPNTVFKAYRDKRRTDSAAVEARRSKMESLFSTLASAGVSRSQLYLAWDFTVASEDNLTDRLIAMRDDAFGQLGDSDLDDGDVDGNSPAINDVAESDYALCADGSARCEQEGAVYPSQQGSAGPWTAVSGGFRYDGTSQSDYAFKRVTGTITVPCYMNAPGATYNPGQPNLPCASGSRLHYEGGADLPSQNGSATWEAPFTCILPRTGDATAAMATGSPGVLFGHGLLQNHRTAELLGLFPAALEGVACGTDWIGLSGIDPITDGILPNGDLSGFLLNMILTRQDLSLFSALPDRSQQGFVNALYLARAMAHPSGLSALPQFDEGSGSALDIDETDTATDLGYYGVSLGGIFGGATTSVAPDWERAVLGVPGTGFSTLITRSTQFNQFLPFLYAAYPDPLSRQIGLSVLQLVWDRGEPSAYAQHMTDDPFANTPGHQVMIHTAFGDHQVANVQTDTLARTIGAAVRTPTLAPGRIDDRPYLFSNTLAEYWTPDQDLVTSAELNVPGGYTGSPAMMFTLDTGEIRTENSQIVGTAPNPDWNIAPLGRTGLTANDGLDPHEPAATSPAAQQMAIPFLLGQGFYDACVSGAPLATDMPPWTVPYTGTPELCTAPPVHEPGQGA